MGIIEALDWIKGYQLSDVILETDCLIDVQAIQYSSIMLSYFDIIKNAELKDKDMSFRFVERHGNNIARI